MPRYYVPRTEKKKGAKYFETVVRTGVIKPQNEVILNILFKFPGANDPGSKETSQEEAR